MPIINKPKHPKKTGENKGQNGRTHNKTKDKTSVGQFSLFVRADGSGYHNHFKEPLKFSLLGKTFSMIFSPAGFHKN
jgi:hypothetical protein